MKILLFIVLYSVVFATGSYADDVFLSARWPTSRVQLTKRFTENAFRSLPQTYLIRRGDGAARTNPTSSRQGRKGGSPMPKQSRRGGPSPTTSTETDWNSKASIEGHGPASLWAFNSINPGDHRDLQSTSVSPGATKTLRTQHVLAVGTGGRVAGRPPENALTQQPEDHPLKAKGQGRTAVGLVEAPVGGYGNIKLETPAGVENKHVRGGTSDIQSIATPGRIDAKVEASVSRGGKAQAGAQFIDRESYPQHMAANSPRGDTRR